MSDELPEERVERLRGDLLAWGERNQREFAWRDTSDPYEVLVAEILLQSTRADAAEPVFESFLDSFPDLAALGRASTDDIAELLEPLGLHNRRAAALVEIGTRCAGEGIPEEESALRELPRVGRYVASAVACFARGEPRPVVDTNVIRVYQRVLGVEHERQRDPRLWDLASEILPSDRAGEFNLALLDFAAAVCTARSPACEECPASEYCIYYDRQDG
jgi:A/G-specific adenine glycosylase